MAINATIQVRRGLLKDFDPTKMLPGEWAVSIDASTSNQIVWMCFAPGVCKRMGTYEDFQNMVYNATGQIIERYEDAFGSILEEVNTNAEAVSANTDIVLVVKSDIVTTYLPQIKSYVSDASASASNAKTYSENAKVSASEAERSAEDAKKYSQNAFSTTPEGYEALVGDVDVLKNSIIQTTDRTLYGSKEGGIKLIGIKGASEQEYYEGKNKIDVEDTTFTTTDNTEKELVSNVHLIADTYTLSWTQSADLTSNTRNTPLYRVSDDSSPTVWQYTSENKNLSAGRKSWTFEITEENDYSFLYWVHTASNDVTMSDFQLEAGDTATDYEPYVGGTASPNPVYPQDIESVGDGGSLGIKAEGKNLITTRGTSGAVNGITVTLNEDGSIVLSGAAGSGHSTITGYNFVANFTGMVSMTGGYSQECHLYPWCTTTGTRPYADESKTTLSTGEQYDSKGEKLFYVEKGLTYEIRPRIFAGTSLDNAVIYPMVRRADIADATYEPYRSKSITIPLNEPLRSIGDVKDEIVCQDGVWGVLKRIGSHTFDGTESGFSREAVPSEGAGGRIAWNGLYGVIKPTPNPSALPNIKCTHYVAVSAGNAYIHVQGVTVNTGQVVYWWDNNHTEGIDSYLAWLSDNNPKLDYELATPTFEPFTDQTPFYGLESFDTVTYISTDSEVEPSIELKFAKTEGDAVTLLNYNQTNLNRIAIAELTSAVLALNQE